MRKPKITVSIGGEEMKPLSQEAVNMLLGKKERNYTVTEASVKDDFCHYTFEIVEGTGIGDTHKVKGVGIIDKDMTDAFSKLNVHLAAIDDIFKHSSTVVNDIDTHHGDELTLLYEVSGFKVKGGEDNQSVILIGNKYISSSGGRIALETPKIYLDGISSYKWYNELKAAILDARIEVELYKEGKCTVPEKEDEPDARQMSIMDNIDEDGDEGEDSYEEKEAIKPKGKKAKHNSVGETINHTDF